MGAPSHVHTHAHVGHYEVINFTCPRTTQVLPKVMMQYHIPIPLPVHLHNILRANIQQQSIELYG